MTIRPVEEATELEDACCTYQASFKDHWGFLDVPFDTMLEYIRHMIATDPVHDLSLWFAAFDEEEMAAVCLCDPRIGSRVDTAMVNILGVRREWRGNGRGAGVSAPHVWRILSARHPAGDFGADASSPTGATRWV